MKLIEMSIEELIEHIDDLEFRLLAGSDERKRIDLAKAELSRKRRLKK